MKVDDKTPILEMDPRPAVQASMKEVLSLDVESNGLSRKDQILYEITSTGILVNVQEALRDIIPKSLPELEVRFCLSLCGRALMFMAAGHGGGPEGGGAGAGERWRERVVPLPRAGWSEVCRGVVDR